MKRSFLQHAFPGIVMGLSLLGAISSIGTEGNFIPSNPPVRKALEKAEPSLKLKPLESL